MPLTILLLFRESAIVVVNPRLTRSPHSSIFRPSSPGIRSPDFITGDIGDIGENVATMFITNKPEFPQLFGGGGVRGTVLGYCRKRDR